MLLVCNYNYNYITAKHGKIFTIFFSCLNRKIIPLNDKYVRVAFRWHVILRNLRRGTTESLEQAKMIPVQRKWHKNICRRLHCLHFNSSNSNKQYNWLLIVLLLFKQTMTSGTRSNEVYETGRGGSESE